MSVTDSVCVSQTGCVPQRQSASVTDSICVSITLLDIIGWDLELFMPDFHQDLFVKFESFCDRNPHGLHFWDVLDILDLVKCIVKLQCRLYYIVLVQCSVWLQ